MQAQLTERQIQRARAYRAEGMAYSEIRKRLRCDVTSDTIRSHCLDVLVDGQARTRAAAAPTSRNGSMVVPFGPADDTAIIAWYKRPEADRENLNRFAASIGRRRHSVANRIATLRKLGKLGE